MGVQEKDLGSGRLGALSLASHEQKAAIDRAVALNGAVSSLPRDLPPAASRAPLPSLPTRPLLCPLDKLTQRQTALTLRCDLFLGPSWTGSGYGCKCCYSRQILNPFCLSFLICALGAVLCVAELTRDGCQGRWRASGKHRETFVTP